MLSVHEEVNIFCSFSLFLLSFPSFLPLSLYLSLCTLLTSFLIYLFCAFSQHLQCFFFMLINSLFSPCTCTCISHAVQLKDIQGHLYNLTNVTVWFSEPQDEPIPDAKLRMELANVVRNTTSLRNGRVPSSIEVGTIKAQGT